MVTKYPGEMCTVTSDCLYGNCMSGHCNATMSGGKCAGPEECNPGLYCDASRTCQQLLAIGSANCTDDWDCKDSICNSKKCTEYLSLAVGELVDVCDDDGLNPTCESATCYNNDVG